MNRMRLRSGDRVVLLVAVVVAILCCVQIWRPRASGKTVVILSPAGETQLSLSRDHTMTVQGERGILLTVTVADNRVCVQESGCPDQVCVNSGWLSQNGQGAACVPAGVSIRVIGEANVDGVTS